MQRLRQNHGVGPRRRGAVVRGIIGTSYIGQSVPRRDLPEKLTGQAKYTADITLPGMLHGKVLRSPFPNARVLSIDTTKAVALPGLRAVLTPFDVPPGRVASDMPILDTRVRFIGDEVAAVAADDEDVAEEALGLIDVEYDSLRYVTVPREALRSTSPRVHEEGNLVGGSPISLERGDVKAGFAEADRVFEETFTTPAHSGAALEPRAAIASWEEDRLTVWKSSRGVHMDRASLAATLEIPEERVRVIGPYLGAGYGNKDESRLSVLAAVLAQRAQRPVKIEYTREEEFVAGRTRHATVTTVKVGVKNSGEITAVHATTIMDTGAYISTGLGVLRRSGQASLYLYRSPNARFDGYLVYTNRPSGGSYRALGAPQGHFALESLMDSVAEDLGIDPLDFRLRNHVPPEGQPGVRTTPVDQIIDVQPVEGGIPFSSHGLEECLSKGAEAIGWRERRRLVSTASGSVKTGLGMSMVIYRGGPGSRSSATIRLGEDGTVHLLAGVIDVGEGATTVLAQIAAEELGVPIDRVKTVMADTSLTPPAPLTAGSMVTFSTGLAVKEAARKLRPAVIDAAAGLLETGADELEIRDDAVVLRGDPGRSVTLRELGRLTRERPLQAEAAIVPGSTEAVVNSFAAHFAEVEVDIETGQVRVVRYVAAHDSGRILNPNLAINQVEGGVSQMLGFTLIEEMITDGRNGATVNPSFLEHKSPTIMDYPEIQVIFADVVDPLGPFAPKGLGEPPSAGVAPAVVNAIYNATGVRVRDLPVTPDRFLNTLQMAREGSL